MNGAPWDPWRLNETGEGNTNRATELLDPEAVAVVSTMALEGGYDGAYPVAVRGFRGGELILILPVREPAEPEH